LDYDSNEYLGDVNMELNKEFVVKLNDIIEKMIQQGQLMVIATKQHGKTNAVMWLLRLISELKIHEQQQITTLIFDTVLNWRYKFDETPYIDYEGIRTLPLVQDLIVDFAHVDTNMTRDAIGQIVMNDFRLKRRLKEKHKGKNAYLNLYVIEEIQNVLGTYSMNGFEGRFWLKMVSECANYGQIILGIGQRLADISTKVIERTRYFLFGATSGDNDLAKIKRMGGNQLKDMVKNLKKGEFIFFDKESNFATIIGFPKFVAKGIPYRYANGNGKGEGYIKRVFLGR